MNVLTQSAEEISIDKQFNILLEWLNKNPRLQDRRNIRNLLLHEEKEKLLQRFLSNEEMLSEQIRVNCLPIFLDNKTKSFSFHRGSNNQKIIKIIFKMLTQYSPNIEILDLKNLEIHHENKEALKALLRKLKHLKSLRVPCGDLGCTIRQILLREDFTRQEKIIKTQLQKIEYIYGFWLSESDCAKLLNILPNLKSFGLNQSFGSFVNYYPKTLNNIIEFSDRYTNLSTLELFIKCCPNAEEISLILPKKGVIENLWRFPLLTRINLHFEDPSHVTELVHLFKITAGRIIQLNYVPN